MNTSASLPELPKSICAWCKTLLRDGPEPISHGMCEACADRERAAHRRRRAIAALVDEQEATRDE